MYFMGISRDEAVNRLNNSVLEEVIRESAFAGTYFRDIYSGDTGKWYKKSWKEFDHLKDIDQKFYC